MTIGIKFDSNSIIKTLRPPTLDVNLEKGLFDEHLKQQLDGIDSSRIIQKNEKKSDFSDDIDEIKSNGLHEYIRNLEEKQMEELREEILEEMGLSEEQLKQMEELREEILEEMGLSEEQLKQMPAEQQKNIEKMIAKKIEQRLALMSTLKKESKWGHAARSLPEVERPFKEDPTLMKNLSPNYFQSKVDESD